MLGDPTPTPQKKAPQKKTHLETWQWLGNWYPVSVYYADQFQLMVTC